MGTMQTRFKSEKKTTKARAKLYGSPDLATDNLGLTWADVNSDKLSVFIACINDCGDALMFLPPTRGGALRLVIYSEGEKYPQEWTTVENAEAALSQLTLSAQEQAGTS
jgi:hypothetical protein